jgi:hypothetical protein
MIVVNYDKGFAKMSQPPAFRNVAGESKLTEASRRRRAAEQSDELAPSYVEHGASPPLRGLGASNDHQPAVVCCKLSLPRRMGQNPWDRPELF